jgi:hypothetical protein
MNSTIKAAQELMETRRVNLRCNMFDYVVEVLHGDMSHFIFQNAISKIRKIHGHRMLLVWTEHCGYHAFFLDDLESWRKYKDV